MAPAELRPFPAVREGDGSPPAVLGVVDAMRHVRFVVPQGRQSFDGRESGEVVRFSSGLAKE